MRKCLHTLCGLVGLSKPSLDHLSRGDQIRGFSSSRIGIFLGQDPFKASSLTWRAASNDRYRTKEERK